MMGDGCCGSQVVDMPLDNVYAGDDGAGYADASVRMVCAGTAARLQDMRCMFVSRAFAATDVWICAAPCRLARDSGAAEPVACRARGCT